jgi:hypothetical protein
LHQDGFYKIITAGARIECVEREKSIDGGTKNGTISLKELK